MENNMPHFAEHHAISIKNQEHLQASDVDINMSQNTSAEHDAGTPKQL